MKFSIAELKNLMSKLSLAVEKSNINPKSGWIELEANTESVVCKVSNLDYYMEATLLAEEYINEEDTFHVTVMAETFIPLVSKLEEDYVDITEHLNMLMLTTAKSSYTFPIIKELGRVKCLDTIPFEATSSAIPFSAKALVSVANINTKGAVGAIMVKALQQFIYVDNIGGITFNENIYVNNFSEPGTDQFKMLLTISQAQLLNVFKGEENVEIELEQKPAFGSQPTLSNKIKISSNNITLILLTQNQEDVERFPSIRLRALAENTTDTHVVIDKKILDKALARLMVFDKKFGIEVLDYSKLVFHEDELELVSVKNKNFEKIPYVSSQNVFEHTAVVRFADLVKQLKAISSKEVDISYGQRPVLVFNSDIKQVIPEIVSKTGV